MLFLLRLFLAQNLVHPLEGVRLGDWVGLLRRERFKVDPICWPRAAWLTGLSFWNSIAARTAERQFARAIEATRVVAPIFVLGHYRSGTTLLHDLLAVDPRYASPTRFQTFNPHTFLVTEPWLAPIVEPFMLPRRVQEDEVAQIVLTQCSPYMDWCFPRSERGYDRYLTFREAEPAEVERWSSSLVRFLKSVTLRAERPLILKSPPHTARIRLLLRLFPDARFVHIRRDPYAVLVSTIRLLKAVRPVFRLRRSAGDVDPEAVLQAYAAMYDAYFDDYSLIPSGQFADIAYEDLERDPIGQVRTVYEKLSLEPFEPIRPALEAHLASIAGYRKNRHPRIAQELRERIAEVCTRCFDVWGYAR